MRMTTRLAPLTLLVFLATTHAYAQTDPAEIARQCIERMNAVADACGENMRTISGRAARRINEFQEQDRPRAARRAANEAIEQLDEVSENCVHRIRMISRRCRVALRQLDAPEELSERVRRATRHALEQVKDAHGASVRRVLRALFN